MFEKFVRLIDTHEKIINANNDMPIKMFSASKAYILIELLFRSDCE